MYTSVMWPVMLRQAPSGGLELTPPAAARLSGVSLPLLAWRRVTLSVSTTHVAS